MDYYEYIKSPQWDKKRKKRLAIDKYTCQGCFVRNKPLDVHHKIYRRLGRERMDDLESLCRKCHNKKHSDETIFVGVCQTCSEVLVIVRRLLKGGWERFVCSDGHMVEKRK